MIDFYERLKNKKIFITGNTGFTGGWTSFWLQSIGANALGYSLRPSTSPSLFKALNLDQCMPTIFGDICNYKLLRKSIIDFQPDLILHLAAQPLVSEGFEKPLLTLNTNVIGTAHILDIARYIKCLKGVLCITTDKVYKNIHTKKNFIETDVIGGIDPYSASKSAAEIIIESYAKSYFIDKKNFPMINVARGGNIIGGGDWSKDRLIPDYVRSVISNQQLDVRSPYSIRPWQHVLDLISGYFLILIDMMDSKVNKLNTWNLGPHELEDYNVKDVLGIISSTWKAPDINFVVNHIKETKNLTLNSNKAKNKLKWNPNWGTTKSIKMTAEWYKQFYIDPKKSSEITLHQINEWKKSNLSTL